VSSVTESRYVRFAAVVADFGHPFYTEERQRDVWNEGAAFSLVVLAWVGQLMAAVMLFVGGREAIPYAVALFLLVIAGMYLPIGYAVAKGVNPWSTEDLSGVRIVAQILPTIACLVGLFCALEPGSAFGLSFVAGGTVGLIIAVFGVRRLSRMQVRHPAESSAAPE